jgi:hypothetical protein
MKAETVIHVAYADTGHWKWWGLGTTAKQATDALMAAWYAHAEITDADPDYLRPDEVTVFSGTPGTGFRDGDPFPRPDGRPGI